MDPDALAWLAEDACMNAWPCPRQVLLGGFLLRAAGGPTRRTNSVNPLHMQADPDGIVGACERIYAGLGRPTLFRVPSIAPRMPPALARHGYAPVAACRTLLADLGERAGATDPAVTFSPEPGEDWLAARSRLNRADAETDRVYRAMTGLIAVPKVFAVLEHEGAIAAMAYAALDRSLAVIESVGTLEPLRGRGYARRVVAALMHWARARGATGACLQVVADNHAANALYAALGFRRELSRYHYWQRAADGA